MWRVPDAMQRNAVRLDVPVLRSVKSRKAYGAALLAVGLAFTCTYLAVPLAERSQLFLLLAAVVVGAWYGGLGPGLLATALSIVGHLAFIKAPYGDDVVRLLFFVLVAGAITVLAAGRRRAEDHARAQREEMAVTLASIGDAVIVTDRAERVTFMNAAAEHLTGWTADEARGGALVDRLRHRKRGDPGARGEPGGARAPREPGGARCPPASCWRAGAATSAPSPAARIPSAIAPATRWARCSSSAISPSGARSSATRRMSSRASGRPGATRRRSRRWARPSCSRSTPRAWAGTSPRPSAGCSAGPCPCCGSSIT